MKNAFSIWWLHPLAIFGVVSGFVAVVAFLIPDTGYQDLWFTPKFFDGMGLAAVLAAIGAFAAGVLMPSIRFRGWSISEDPKLDPELSSRTLLILYRVAAALALAGYAVWIATAVSRGLNLAVLADVVAGKKLVLYGIRMRYLGNIPGITTCTQFAVAAAVLAPLAGAQLGWKKIRKSLTLLFLLALLRAILNTERLAVVEMAVPMCVVVAAQVLATTTRRWLRIWLKAAPVAGVALLFLVFSAFEYFRSWTSYYASIEDSFWEFAASRLLGYYVTAFNNGAYLMDRLSAPLGVPCFTGSFLWRFPLLKNLTESIFPVSSISNNYFDILQSGANAEFNNGGGLFGPLLDFGRFGALAYWIAVGFVCGSLYRLFRRRSAWGLCLYPILFLGLLDVARGLYWAGGRAIPPLCFLTLSGFLLAIQQKRAKARGNNRVSAPSPVAVRSKS